MHRRVTTLCGCEVGAILECYTLQEVSEGAHSFPFNSTRMMRRATSKYLQQQRPAKRTTSWPRSHTNTHLEKHKPLTWRSTKANTMVPRTLCALITGPSESSGAMPVASLQRIGLWWSRNGDSGRVLVCL